jgi:large subunit ribosomal protein L13
LVELVETTRVAQTRTPRPLGGRAGQITSFEEAFVRGRGTTFRWATVHRTNERVRQTHVRTYSPKPGDVQREWHVIDATDIVLGKLAVQAANLLRGKHKPTFAPHMDMGDFVIVINAEKVALTGDKKTTKLLYRHSGYPGGLTATPVGVQLDRDARKVIEGAVWGMLPKNKLGRQVLKKLKVYAGPTHPHQAQQAKPFEISQVSQ